MVLRLYNSLSRSKEEFKPLEPPKVGLYTCGPTVYNFQHEGNYRTYIFEDILKRTMALLGFKVRHVMNITDVGHLVSQADEGEDKMEVGAAREGKTAWEIAKLYTEAFLADCRDLNLDPPDVLCRATEHIPEQIEMIQRLEAKGLIYRTSDGLYYDTSKFPGYGRLAGAANIEGLKAGARVEANPEKKNGTDFAVWKFSPKDKKRQMEWNSPWGIGFPGWHIECSSMAMRYLGETFDIHCGGVDHIPIHHSNEIAQAEGATGKPFVKYWLHGEFLLMDAAKMAKSEGGFVTVAELKKRGFDPLDYRYHCLTAHYRKQLDFTWDVLEGAKTARRRLREMALSIKDAETKPACADHRNAFIENLSDDLNVSAALSTVWDCAKSGNPPGARLAFMRQAEEVLALGLFTEDSYELPPELKDVLDRRAQARAAKDYALSDKLRDELLKGGIVVKDTPQGQRWVRK